jgi:uncharacterized protein (DUF58 family)
MRRGRSLLLPTRNLAALFFVLAVMWYSAANQNNAPSYLLLFALSSVFLVSIPHTFSNLGGLNVKTESPKPTFAGQEVSLPIEIVNESGTTRHGVDLSLADHINSHQRIDEIPAKKAARLILRFPTSSRGEHETGKLYLTSAYPFGFVKAKRPVLAPQRYLIYPKPAGDPKLPIDRKRQNQNTIQTQLGDGDDFAGVRAYVPGESQRHIDWKAVARGQPMMTKQFSAEADGALYIDLAAARFENLEERLSQLALWLIEAERAHRPYGLRLPGTEIAPSLGDFHFHRCLRQLALFK